MAKGGDSRWIVSTGDIAEIFGVSSRTVRQWGEGGCPKEGRGKWNLPDVIKWRSGYVPKSGDDAKTMRDRKLLADTIYREQKAKKEQILVEVIEGKKVSREEVEQAWASRIVEARVGMFGWAKTLPSFLLGLNEKEMEKVLSREVQVLWEQYARDGPFTPK